jgi:hypothetical protein
MPNRALEESLLILAPKDQPNTVHEVAGKLLPAYKIDGGSVRLAGCLLEDRLFLRATAQSADRSVELFLDQDGKEVPPQMVESLGMGETVELDRLPEQSDEAIERLCRRAEQLLRRDFQDDEAVPPFEYASVWCKFAEGKIRFTIGQNSVDLAFADWARSLSPQPIVCPHTNKPTYHLTATDDGRIAAVEEVAACEESGQRVLAQELVTCAATNHRVLPEFAETCPVTNETVLRAKLEPCRVCRQKVSPSALVEGTCEACSRFEPISKADPRLARVLDEYPLLDRWRRWQLAESATAYHLTARGWFRRLFLLIDKESLELKFLATGNRLRSEWDEVEPARYEFVLRG